MGVEIERRFLVKNKEWEKLADAAQPIRQCYLARNINGWTTRIRILAKENALLTLKAPAEGITFHEFEYSIPLADAEKLWHLTPFRLKKTRFNLSINPGKWVVDSFEEGNSPLVLAEVELLSPNQVLKIPEWCSEEVTGKSDLSNAALAETPINKWSRQKRQIYGLC